MTSGPQAHSDRGTGHSLPRVHSFAPIATKRARVLVLGSMPGEASLRAGQYYAHPHNAFWPIVGELCGASPSLSYAERCRRLHGAGIAVWDVLQSCVRRGSLDADIDAASIVANDFARFFTAHPDIELVCCNGGVAHACYRRHVLPSLSPALRRLSLVRLPSTSPAHAGMARAEKLRRWRAAIGPLLRLH